LYHSLFFNEIFKTNDYEYNIPNNILSKII
jgi:hypothetical protein